MGNAAIIIRSVGPHQNKKSYDAERIAGRCVDELRALGHSIICATVETGGCSIDLDKQDEWAKADPATFAVTDPEHPARCAYERYLYSSGGKSLVSGAELPSFDALSPEIRSAWMAAVDHTATRLVR